MKNCLFLDGPNAGEVVCRPMLPDYWEFPVKWGIRKFEINPKLDSKSVAMDRTRYKLTFISIDRTWGLYSLAGESDMFLKLGDWISRPQELKRPHPIYMEHRK